MCAGNLRCDPGIEDEDGRQAGHVQLGAEAVLVGGEGEDEVLGAGVRGGDVVRVRVERHVEAAGGGGGGGVVRGGILWSRSATMAGRPWMHICSSGD